MSKINRTELLKVRLTESEKLELEEISSKTGLDYSKIVRRALLDFKLNYERREEKEKDVYGLPRTNRKINQ